MSNKIEWIEEYLRLGWKLCATRPWEKGPYMHGWGHLDLDAAHWRARPDDGVGVILGRSGLATIDVDDFACAVAALAALDIDLEALLSAPDAVQIVSREGRAKLVYRVRENQRAHVSRKRALSWKAGDGGSFCVVEFRAGSEQLQDVLPPSIHPATGRPYKWKGDFREVPVLPDELAAVWRDWEAARDVMRDADPNRETRSAVQPEREVRFHGSRSTGDVIGKWNETYDVWDVMKRPALAALYEQKGKRWRRKGSKEIPGVVALEDRRHPGRHRVYSHHAGDPLIPHAATDAFGLYCLAEHGGEVRAAVKAAAYELGLPDLERQHVEAVGEEQVQALVASGGGTMAEAVAEDGGGDGGELVAFPSYELPEQTPPGVDELAAPPGALAGRTLPVAEAQDLAEWIAGRVGKAKVSHVVSTTLAIVSHLAGRRYVTERGGMPGVLFAVLDDATINLAPYLRCVDDVLDLLGGYDSGSTGGTIRYLTEKAGNELSTTTGLVEHYRKSPRLLWGSTSIATMLERESRQINPTFQSMLDKLGELRHGSSLHFAAPRQDTYTVRVPAVSGLWALTPHSVGGLVRTTTRSGLLQQTLVADALAESAREYPGGSGLSGAVVDALRHVTSRAGTSTHVYPEDDFQKYGPVRVPVTDEARDAFEALSGEIRASCGAGDALREYPLRGASRGWAESAESIALGLAALRSPHAPIVDIDLAAWACGWVADCWKLFRERIGYASEDTADVERAILERLRAAGRDGATTSELRRSLRVLRALSTDRRDEILETLTADGLIASARRKGGVRWYLRKAAP